MKIKLKTKFTDIFWFFFLLIILQGCGDNPFQPPNTKPASIKVYTKDSGTGIPIPGVEVNLYKKDTTNDYKFLELLETGVDGYVLFDSDVVGTVEEEGPSAGVFKVTATHPSYKSASSENISPKWVEPQKTVYLNLAKK